MSDIDTGDRDTGDFDPSEVVTVKTDIWHPSFKPATVAPVAPKTAAGAAALAALKQQLQAQAEQRKPEVLTEGQRAVVERAVNLTNTVQSRLDEAEKALRGCRVTVDKDSMENVKFYLAQLKTGLAGKVAHA